jgi:hypothetical protein
MEAIGDFSPDQAAWPGAEVFSGVPRLAAVPAHADTADELDGALVRLQALGATAVADSALFGLAEASEFAGRVEELSRTVDYLQVIAAEAVDRTRKHAATAGMAAAPAGTGAGPDTAAATVWLTGWHDQVSGSAGLARDDAGLPRCLDDGYRNTIEFLRARLRISASEARRRLCLAAAVLPRAGMAGQPVPAAHEELAAAVASGTIASRAATIITLSLDRVRHACPPETSARMEHALTLTAVENDHDFLTRIARRWTDALDQDGAEPGEEELRQRQGAFVRRPRRGLHHVEIFATTDQFEHLATVMNVAANPRTSSAGVPSAAATDVDVDGDADADALDQRSRPQKLLDGLVGACKAALATGDLPAAGGLRPQVMVTIDCRDLFKRFGGVEGTATGREPAECRTPAQTGRLLFTGPVTASTVRKIACDADIIPVLLGGEGRILDVGRASRIFPPHIRKAITARDQGCAFPQCTIPAPWCEAHHISYWSRGGSTAAANGTLLCSHHHHLIHKEQWTIQSRSGVPWFIPPPHVDPRQMPRRNRYFRLD